MHTYLELGKEVLDSHDPLHVRLLLSLVLFEDLVGVKLATLPTLIDVYIRTAATCMANVAAGCLHIASA